MQICIYLRQTKSSHYWSLAYEGWHLTQAPPQHPLPADIFARPQGPGCDGNGFQATGLR